MARRCCCDGIGGNGVTCISIGDLCEGVVEAICDACGGILDTNFAITDLTFTGNRLHSLHNPAGPNDYNLQIVGEGTSNFDFDIDNGGWFFLDSSAAQLGWDSTGANPYISVISGQTEIYAPETLLRPVTGGNAPILRFYEDDGDTDSVGFRAPATLAASTLYTLPLADGMADDVLATNGLGQLFWTTNLTGGDVEEVVRSGSDPAGAPNVGEDLFAQITDGKLYYNDGAGNWVEFPFSANLDTNLFITDNQTLGGNYVHLLDGNVFTATGATTSGWNVGNTSGGELTLGASAAQLDFAKSAGTSRIALTSATTTITGQTISLTLAVGQTAPVLRFYEDQANGVSYTSFQAPAQLTGNVVYILPADDGDPGEQLTTDGSGVLSWESAGASADTNLFITNNQVLGGNYTHSLAGNTFTATGATTSAWDVGNTSGGELTLSASSAQLDFAKSAGTSRISLTSATTTVTGQTISLTPATGQTAPVLRFYENQANGTNYVGLKAGAAVGPIDTVWALPLVDGTPGQAMVTDGSGQLSFASFGSGVTVYTFDFDATTSWGAASGGLYAITRTAAQTGIATPRMIQVFENDGSNNLTLVLTHDATFLSTGDVRIRVTETPNGRFAGRLVVFG